MSKKYDQLSLDERRTIYKLLEAGKSKNSIAEYLGRHRSTIFREVHRNTVYNEDPFMRGYFHVCAQELAKRRREKLKKLVLYPELKAYVIHKLGLFWSPDQIAGYLKSLGDRGFYVCRETIYDFIYSAEGRKLKLYRYLRKAFKNRRKRFQRKCRSSRGIPESLSLSYRPEEVKNRNNFGHWEGDLVIFRREYGRANITTLVERKTRYTLILKNQSTKTDDVMPRIRDKLHSLPAPARQSLTLDRGSEFVRWNYLRNTVKMGTFYCDPHSPWQKGSNENTNGRIRRFLPSDTNLNELSTAHINAVAKQLNNTPRKCLGYKTPHQVFHEHLQEHNNRIPCST